MIELDEVEKDLDAFVRNLSLEERRKLAREAVIRRNQSENDPTSRLILRCLADDKQAMPPRKLSALRVFCTPFEDLLIDDPQQVENSRVPLLPRSIILPLWRWLGSAEALDEALARHTDAIDAAIAAKDPLRIARHADILHGECLSVLRQLRAERRNLPLDMGGQAFHGDALEPLFRMIAQRHEVARMHRIVPRLMREFSGGAVEELRELFEDMQEEDPADLSLLCAAAMLRMAHPYHILRLIRSISRFRHDVQLAESEFSLAVGKLLDDNDAIIAAIPAYCPIADRPEEVLRPLMRFARHFIRFTGELNVERRGPWGQRLLAQRSRVSELMRGYLSTLYSQCMAQLPLPPTTPRSPYPPLNLREAVRPGAVRRAGNLSLFAATAHNYADRMAFAGAMSECEHDLYKAFEYYSDQFLIMIPLLEEEYHPQAAGHATVLATFLKSLEGEEMAELFLRRVRHAGLNMDDSVQD